MADKQVHVDGEVKVSDGPGNPERPGLEDTAGSPDEVRDPNVPDNPGNRDESVVKQAPSGDAPRASDAVESDDGEVDDEQRARDLKAGRAIDRDPVRGSVASPPKDNRQDVPDELKSDGAIHGGESKVDPDDTLSDEDREPGKPGLPRASYAQPVFVDAQHRRTDNDALEGHAVDVVDGPHKGRFGVFWSVEEHSKEDGAPSKIVVRTSDHQDGNEYVGVDYDHVRPSPPRNNRL